MQPGLVAEEQVIPGGAGLGPGLLQGADRRNIDIGHAPAVEQDDVDVAEQRLDLGAKIVGVAEEHAALKLQDGPPVPDAPQNLDIALRPHALREDLVAALAPADEGAAHADNEDEAGQDDPGHHPFGHGHDAGDGPYRDDDPQLLPYPPPPGLRPEP